MYTRFRYGLSKPSLLGQFFKDSFKRVWAFFFILALITVTPYLLIELTQSGLTSKQLPAINDQFRTQMAGNYQIVDGKLDLSNLAEGESRRLRFGAFSIDLNASRDLLDASYIYFVLEEEGIRYQLSVFKVSFHTYEELGLKNFDFSDVRTTNIVVFTQAIQNLVVKNNAIHKTFMSFAWIVYKAFSLITMMLLASIFVFKPHPYGIKFRMVVYCSTIYVVTELILLLFSVETFAFLGLLLVLIYTYRALGSIKQV